MAISYLVKKGLGESCSIYALATVSCSIITSSEFLCCCCPSKGLLIDVESCSRLPLYPTYVVGSVKIQFCKNSILCSKQCMIRASSRCLRSMLGHDVREPLQPALSSPSWGEIQSHSLYHSNIVGLVNTHRIIGLGFMES